MTDSDQEETICVVCELEVKEEEDCLTRLYCDSKEYYLCHRCNSAFIASVNVKKWIKNARQLLMNARDQMAIPQTYVNEEIKE